MTTDNMHESLIGKVYKTGLTPKPVRVIMHDNITLFYEVWWEHANDWGYRTTLKSHAIYYRTPLKEFISSAVYQYTDPLSEEEISVHRPDLPLYLCRNPQLSWTAKAYPTLKEYEIAVSPFLSETVDLIDLDISKIFLEPFGPKGGPKKKVLISSLNTSKFSGLELLWNAHNAESEFAAKIFEKGIGLYRSGFMRKTPIFYIGGFYDRAEFLKEA